MLRGDTDGGEDEVERLFVLLVVEFVNVLDIFIVDMLVTIDDDNEELSMPSSDSELLLLLMLLLMLLLFSTLSLLRFE